MPLSKVQQSTKFVPPTVTALHGRPVDRVVVMGTIVFVTESLLPAPTERVV